MRSFMLKTRLCASGIAFALAPLALVPACAVADIKFPSAHAACVAQAWVPANTDPEFDETLGPFISEFARRDQWGAVIAQRGCKP